MTTYVSIGIIACNEENVIAPSLASLFQQSFLAEVRKRNLRCEILCLANGCTDNTAGVAGQIFYQQSQNHAAKDFLSCRVVNIEERGKIQAWNLFVHTLSAKDARFLVLMDADILIHQRHTLRNMIATLESNAEASIATDLPCKDVAFKKRKSLMERFSLAAADLTRAGDAQLCGQLYCIRANIARRIYLPKDLAACEDGFVKTLVCTDFLVSPLSPRRIVCAPEAEHTFEAYTSVFRIFKNQKRQMIGQTIVHILVDDYLKTLSVSERMDLNAALRERENSDPLWLKRLIADHVSRTKHFWQLFPGLIGLRFKRLARLSGFHKMASLPVVVAGFVVSLICSWSAHRFLKNGYTQYWPEKNELNARLLGEQRLGVRSLIATRR